MTVKNAIIHSMLSGFLWHVVTFEAGFCLAAIAVICIIRYHVRQRELAAKARGADKMCLRKETLGPQCVAAMSKAHEFLDEVKAAQKAFIDNAQVTAWKDRYSPAFVILEKCSALTLDADVRFAMGIFADLRGNVDQWNHAFIVSEALRCDSLFGRIDSFQREACVSDEMSTLVIAGAGSGKTTTIQKKVEYLVGVQGVSPNDILLLSFTNKAADEMTARLAESMPNTGMVASTFHKFGLNIVKSHLEGAYDVCRPNFCEEVVLHALSPGEMTDAECRGALRFFASCANAEPDNLDKFDSLGDYIDATRSADFRTLRGMMNDGKDEKTTFSGECVKSFEELEIANWLFLNGIKYEYERKYNGSVPDDETYKRRTYKPDFYLLDYNIWIEHFGVDENGRPPKFFSAAESRAYIDGMKWKRDVHATNGTVLVESYSWWHRKGLLTRNLWKALQRHGVVRHGVNPRLVWSKLVASKKSAAVREFAKLVSSFISLAKSRRIGPDDIGVVLEKMSGDGHCRVRAESFLEVVRPLYRRYVQALKAENSVDFHDMINMAADYVREQSESIHPYKYVIIDEFQDVSASRAELIHAVVLSTGAKLFCVGDDWQSIYRFAGSDISLFTEFPKHFGFTRIVKLENTYRNSQELMSVAGQFIMGNPCQIKKNLKSSFHVERPVSCITYNAKQGITEALHQALLEIAVETGGKKATVMLLGRHNQEAEWPIGVDGIIDNGKKERYIWPSHPELELFFLTVHKAKGLEADYVVILNFHDDLLGFPNKIADDPLLELLLSKRECVPFAEERRVFYVALTRARNRVFIMVPDVGPSAFLGDLPAEVQPKYCNGNLDAATCPKCKKGFLRLRKGHSEFYGCTNYPRCDYMLPLQKIPITFMTMRCHCGGFLVPCLNPRNGQYFLGCTEYSRLRYIEHKQMPMPEDMASVIFASSDNMVECKDN